METYPDEVLAILKQLDINKTTGPDGIPLDLLRETAEQIAPSLSRQLNKSLQQDVVPRTGN